MGVKKRRCGLDRFRVAGSFVEYPGRSAGIPEIRPERRPGDLERIRDVEVEVAFQRLVPLKRFFVERLPERGEGRDIQGGATVVPPYSRTNASRAGDSMV